MEYTPSRMGKYNEKALWNAAFYLENAQALVTIVGYDIIEFARFLDTPNNINAE